MTAAFPLTWPDTIPRSKARESGQFRTSLAAALENVRRSLTAFGRDTGKPIRNIVISSNVTLGMNRPEDPGVAVWFIWDGTQICIPVDRYQKVEGNLQAIHHIIEARRTEMRHGTLALVRAAMKGLTALPPPESEPTPPHWSDVLRISASASPEEIRTAHKARAKEAHPDLGGSADQMARINAARDAALADRESAA